jgi:hypothetical protein
VAGRPPGDRVLDHADSLSDLADSLSDLVESARSIFVEDLERGHVTVLVEMLAGARSVPGLGEQVAARMAPWREFAEAAVRGALASSPLARLLSAKDVAHGVVAGFSVWNCWPTPMETGPPRSRCSTGPPRWPCWPTWPTYCRR